jgi:hypothetical protein
VKYLKKKKIKIDEYDIELGKIKEKRDKDPNF